MIHLDPDNSVNLYYNGGFRIGTTSAGVDITGSLTTTSTVNVGQDLTVDGQINLGTDATDELILRGVVTEIEVIPTGLDLVKFDVSDRMKFRKSLGKGSISV